jgi:hypothetical protein
MRIPRYRWIKEEQRGRKKRKRRNLMGHLHVMICYIYQRRIFTIICATKLLVVVVLGLHTSRLQVPRFGMSINLKKVILVAPKSYYYYK